MTNQFDYQDSLCSGEEAMRSSGLFKRAREIINEIDYKPHTGFRLLRDKRNVVFLQHVQFIEDCLPDDDGIHDL